MRPGLNAPDNRDRFSVVGVEHRASMRPGLNAPDNAADAVTGVRLWLLLQ